jgi:hypothetical protein
VFVFQRHRTHTPADPADPVERGHYAKSLDPKRSGCGWGVIRCPECGKLATLGDNHEVASDGSISPSLVCPFPPCTFHVSARFADWAD